MTVWLVLNTAGLLMVMAVVYLLLRQLGYVLQRIGPVGARASSEGPRIGESISPAFPLAATNGERSKLLVFVSEHCAACKLVRQGAEQLARDWYRDAEIFLIYDGSEDEEQSSTVIGRSLHVVEAFALRERLAVQSVPFAVVTTGNGLVVSKGLVNEISHLESLLEFERSKRRESLADRATGSTLNQVRSGA